MRTREKMTQGEFVKDIEKRIAIRREILEFVENVYFPMMALKFNGKVYNKRFINALNEEGKKMNEYLYVREREYDHIEISVRVNPYNYTDCETIYVKCNLTNDGRIDYDSTIIDNVDPYIFATPIESQSLKAFIPLAARMLAVRWENSLEK